jgi:class 3 adenylate cyclase
LAAESGDLVQEYREFRQRAIEAPDARLVIFVDLVGSSAYKEIHGALEGALRCEYHNRLVSDVAAEFGLQRVKSLGDGLLLQRPVEQNLDVPKLVRKFVVACLTSPERTRLLDQPRIESRIGIALGRVVALPAEDILGPAVDLAARLQGLAKPGQAIAEASVMDGGKGRRRKEPVNTVTLRGLEEPVNVVEVVGKQLKRSGIAIRERWRDYRFVVSIHPITDQGIEVEANWLRAVVDLSYRGILRSQNLSFLAVEPGPAFASALADPAVCSCFSVPLAIMNNRELLNQIFGVTRVKVAGYECNEVKSAAPAMGPIFSRHDWRVPTVAGKVGSLQNISYTVEMITRRTQPLFTMISEHEVVNPTFALHLSGLAGAQLSFAAHFPPGTRYETSFHPDIANPTGIELRVEDVVPPGAGVTFLWSEPRLN